MDGFVARVPHRTRHRRASQAARLLRRPRHSDRLESRRQYVLFDRFFSSAARRQRVESHVRDQRDGPATRTTTACRSRPATPTRRRSSTGSQSAGVPWRYYVKDYDPTIHDRQSGRRRRTSRSCLQVPLLAMPRFVRSQRSPRTSSISAVLQRRAARPPARRLLHRPRRPQRAPAGQADRGADASCARSSTS